MILITPLLQDSVSVLAEMWQSVAFVYPLLGLCGGYALVMFFNPLRQPLGDGFRCIGRYKRIWLTFALLGFGYFVFQIAHFHADRKLGRSRSEPSRLITELVLAAICGDLERNAVTCAGRRGGNFR